MYRLEELTELLRGMARRYVLTANTIRYLIEYRCIVGLLSDFPGPYDLLVDLGAGSGEMSARLVESGFARQAVAVEPDGANFKKLTSRYAKLKHCRCLNSSIESMTLDPGSADLVLSTQVLEHIADDDTAVARIAELTAPKGFAVISVPHPPEIFPNPGHVRPGYTCERLTDLFQKHGFQMIRHDYFLVLWTLRRLVAAQELGRIGKLLPVWWADREANLSTVEKTKQQPHGLAALFQKR
jgi:SAM-dependent methyltransferase